MKQFDTSPIQYRHIEHMHDRQNDSYENLDIFITDMAFVYAWVVPLLADQLLPQLLVEPFDTLPLQSRHIDHMHKGVWFKKKIDKMTAVRT